VHGLGSQQLAQQPSAPLPPFARRACARAFCRAAHLAWKAAVSNSARSATYRAPAAATCASTDVRGLRRRAAPTVVVARRLHLDGVELFRGGVHGRVFSHCSFKGRQHLRCQRRERGGGGGSDEVRQAYTPPLVKSAGFLYSSNYSRKKRRVTTLEKTEGENDPSLVYTAGESWAAVVRL
jgi:hypothetical protein